MKTITVCVGRILGVEETDRCPDCVDYVPLADYERLRCALEEIEKWENEPNSIPKSLLDCCREAIKLEFGDNGTDGYYKRILSKVFSQARKALEELWIIKKQKAPMKAVYYIK